MTNIKIDVWSDIACPWCYIGKRRLEAGIGAFQAGAGSVPVDVEYHSFQLAPETPLEFDGSEVDFLVGYKGIPEAQARQMIDRVTAIAHSVGLRYDFDGLRHTNTVKAHQLPHYAKVHGVQADMKERLLRAYFVEGRHLGRDEELAALAAEVGLDSADVVRSLAEEEYVEAVREDQRLAARIGISGVPFYVIQGRYALSGAQPPQAFAETLAQVAEGRAQSA